VKLMIAFFKYTDRYAAPNSLETRERRFMWLDFGDAFLGSRRRYGSALDGRWMTCMRTHLAMLCQSMAYCEADFGEGGSSRWA